MITSTDHGIEGYDIDIDDEEEEIYFVLIDEYDSLYSNNSTRTDPSITSYPTRLNMLLKSATVFGGVMLMIGESQAQVAWTTGSAGQGAHTVVPESSIPGPDDAGTRAHTNIRELVPHGPVKPLPGVAPRLWGHPLPARSTKRRPP